MNVAASVSFDEPIPPKVICICQSIRREITGETILEVVITSAIRDEVFHGAILR